MDVVFICRLCLLKFYGTWEHCPACGCTDAVAEAVEFGDLNDLERRIRLHQAAEKENTYGTT